MTAPLVGVLVSAALTVGFIAGAWWRSLPHGVDE